MTSLPASLDLTAMARSFAGLAKGPTARSRRGPGRVEGGPTTKQFLRYILVGVLTSALYAGVFVLFHPVGYVWANAIGMILSTAVANELHRRLTFRAAGRKAWLPAQLESGGLAVIGLGATTLALAAANAVVPGAPWPFEVALVLAATGLIGVAKFFVLRGLIFCPTC